MVVYPRLSVAGSRTPDGYAPRVTDSDQAPTLSYTRGEHLPYTTGGCNTPASRSTHDLLFSCQGPRPVRYHRAALMSPYPLPRSHEAPPFSEEN